MAANENDRKNGKTLKLEQLWAKADLDVPTFLMMIKGSLAPTIAIAMFQAPAVANHYGGTGYLIAIMAVLGFPVRDFCYFTSKQPLTHDRLCHEGCTLEV